MENQIFRRDFLKAAPAAMAILAHAAEDPAASQSSSRIMLEPFDYRGVRLLSSHWQQQVQQAREFYFSLSDDDILHGFRAAAGLPAPGTPLGGRCEKDSSPIFGQWLSGMARLSRATDDSDLQAKAVRLMREWGKTVKPDSDCRMSHSDWDKLACGLVDMHVYGGEPAALPLLRRVTDWASKNLNHDNRPPAKFPHGSSSGSPSEWYTLPENLYRAYQATGDPRFKTFAEVWLYHSYWNKFADTAAPADAHGVHAYSHVNTFSSAAMHYEVTGDPTTLRILKNAYDYLQNTQCFATGGYGPDERLLAPNGGLGKAIKTRPGTFETVCGSWAGFKLARYLMRFTGEARFGDWIERLLYNGVGAAALPLTGRGSSFYYSDYPSGGGAKAYRYDNFTCCSGTYIQSLADYHNLIYYKDSSSLYVNLYVPSEVTWNHQGNDIKITQETDYPLTGSIKLTLDMKQRVEFPLRFRVPEWSNNMSFQVNGIAANATPKPGAWATLARQWSAGDTVEISIPLRFRWQPVDLQNPDRTAIVRGPLVMPLEFRYLNPLFRPPAHADQLNNALTPGSGAFRVRGTDGRRVMAMARPFFQYAEGHPYLMYIDRKLWTVQLW